MDIVDFLKNNGKSVTRERIDVFHGAKKLNLFQANDLIKKLPDIGRASIFRTLSLFVEIGVLRKYTLGTGGDFYEISDTSHHEYFECSLCHTVLLFHTGVVCKTLGYLAQKQGYILQNHQMLLSGICPSCRGGNNFSENN